MKQYIENLQIDFLFEYVDCISELNPFSVLRRRKAKKLEEEYWEKLSRAKSEEESETLYKKGLCKISMI